MRGTDGSNPVPSSGESRANRTGVWAPHRVGSGGSKNGVGETAVATVAYGGPSDAIIVGSGEEPNGPWTPGLVAFFACLLYTSDAADE